MRYRLKPIAVSGRKYLLSCCTAPMANRLVLAMTASSHTQG